MWALRLKWNLKLVFKIGFKIILNKILNLNSKLNFEGCKPDQKTVRFCKICKISGRKATKKKK